MLFEKTVCDKPKTARTQYADKSAESWEDVEECVLDMFSDEDDFVTLIIAEISHSVRYVQSAYTGKGLVVQLGLEDENGTRLVEKYCS